MKIFICIFSLIVLNSCLIKDNNWKISLINNYEIWRSDKDKIQIGLNKYGNSIITIWNYELIGIPTKIKKYSICYPYICAEVLPQENINKNNISNTSFYILDTLEQKTFGPMTKDEFNEYINSIFITIYEWIEINDIEVRSVK